GPGLAGADLRPAPRRRAGPQGLPPGPGVGPRPRCRPAGLGREPDRPLQGPGSPGAPGAVAAAAARQRSGPGQPGPLLPRPGPAGGGPPAAGLLAGRADAAGLAALRPGPERTRPAGVKLAADGRGRGLGPQGGGRAAF